MKPRQRMPNAARVKGAFLLYVSALTGCLAFVPHPPGRSVSWGAPAAGVLLAGKNLCRPGQGFARSRPDDPTCFGTDRLVDAIDRATSQVMEKFPGTLGMRVGDLSLPFGGRHSRHHSHRSGRDADLMFYLTFKDGQPIDARSWLAFTRTGAALQKTKEARGLPGDVALFDTPRNWTLVRSLLLDESARVQWIFCSEGTKARLLRYAAQVETHPDVLARAAWVLHQPSQGNPHADHFHVRIGCSNEDVALGCQPAGPVWPWQRRGGEKLHHYDVLDDAFLLAEMLAPLTSP